MVQEHPLVATPDMAKRCLQEQPASKGAMKRRLGARADASSGPARCPASLRSLKEGRFGFAGVHIFIQHSVTISFSKMHLRKTMVTDRKYNFHPSPAFPRKGSQRPPCISESQAGFWTQLVPLTGGSRDPVHAFQEPRDDRWTK